VRSRPPFHSKLQFHSRPLFPLEAAAALDGAAELAALTAALVDMAALADGEAAAADEDTDGTELPVEAVPLVELQPATSIAAPPSAAMMVVRFIHVPLYKTNARRRRSVVNDRRYRDRWIGAVMLRRSYVTQGNKLRRPPQVFVGVDLRK